MIQKMTQFITSSRVSSGRHTVGATVVCTLYPELDGGVVHVDQPMSYRSPITGCRQIHGGNNSRLRAMPRPSPFTTADGFIFIPDYQGVGAKSFRKIP